jgi:high affinity sulfate transporter 1
MSEFRSPGAAGWRQRLTRVAPGVAELLAYRRTDLPGDIVAGLSVAAVALPVGVAYAQLAGFRPEVGLYASILPLAAYALFGTSRQLIVGPDAATCAIVASAVTPLAAGNYAMYFSLSLTLAFLAGVFCIIARFLRLGALADFLSQAILVGFLNGTALSIALGQIGKILGFSETQQGIIPRFIECLSKLGLTHLPTLGIGLAALTILILCPLLIPRLPAALAAMVVTGFAVKLLGLDAMGVQVIGAVPGGLPALRIPAFPRELLPDLCAGAAGIALIGFTSMMLTARSFAAKNRYDVDVDREFAALGAANIAAALSQGFAISGADSRTAVSDAAGSRTRLTGVITAVVLAAVLLFFTGPLRYVPAAALGAVLVGAAFSLFNFRDLKEFYQIDRRELALSLLATIGVVTVGTTKAIFVAVILALLRFVSLISRPRVEVLGSVAGMTGLHSIDRHQNATTIPGLLLLRFNGPIVFFNASFFKSSILQAVEAAGPGLKWLVIDMIPVTIVDMTGLHAARELIGTLHERGVVFIAAGRATEWRQWSETRGLTFVHRSFPSLAAAIEAYEQQGESESEGGSEAHFKLIHDSTA